MAEHQILSNVLHRFINCNLTYKLTHSLFFQCFSAVGLVTGKTFDQKSRLQQSQKLLPRDQA